MRIDLKESWSLDTNGKNRSALVEHLMQSNIESDQRTLPLSYFTHHKNLLDI